MKIKIKQKRDKTIVDVTMRKNELLIDNEIKTIVENKYTNIFQLSVHQKAISKRNVLEYVGPHCVPLTDYLKKTISKQTFIYILVQIVAEIENMRSKNLTTRNLLLDLRYTFINTNTCEIFYIYLPVLSNPLSTDFLDFFRIILHSVNPEKTEDVRYLTEFSQFLREQSTFSSEALQGFLCKQSPNAAMQFRRLMGGHSGFIASNQAEYYRHYHSEVQNDDKNFSDNNSAGENTTVLNNSSYYDSNSDIYADADTATTILNPLSGEGTTILNHSSKEIYQNDKYYPYLIRLSTNEKIVINKPVFRLGKEKDYVDYFVYNNGAVSRSHANIITRNGRFYIMDLHTTNYTYINCQVIPENVEVEIFDGNVLKLANEEFVFHVG